MKNTTSKYLATALACCGMAAVLVSCDDMFEPAIENNLGMEYMYENASYAEGILGNAYTRIPCSSFPFSEVATDDAVSNDADNAYRKIASGQWTSNYNPLDQWTNCRAAIMYLNLFLANAEKVHWANDSVAARLYCEREMGEAYGLRAMYLFYLLQAHSGYTDDGRLMGVPIVTVPESTDNYSNQERRPFRECIDSINADIDRAIAMLPTEYADISRRAELPAKYQDDEEVTVSRYNRVFGSKFSGRMCGKIAEAFRAKALLLAASPAYEASGVTWAEVADAAAIVLDRIGNIDGMHYNGWKWYANANFLDQLDDAQEMIWRTERSQSNSWESDNFPPSLYGNGRINPTQNFVDAFPMANGYPIDHEKSGYDPANPYKNRDPRLAAYVVCNGSTMGVNGAVITTAADGGTQDALNNVAGKSTRTGYYLRKLMRETVNLDPTVNSTQYHYTPRIRYTEMFLIYAEAANEAWGPTGVGTHDYSAYDVVHELRGRCNSRISSRDPYLTLCKADKEKMRQLIRNERRLELSFEGFRFWDIRRYGQSLTETARGMSVNQTENTMATFDVDTRGYQQYQQYGPIPYSEVLKFGDLLQNKGW